MNRDINIQFKFFSLTTIPELLSYLGSGFEEMLNEYRLGQIDIETLRSSRSFGLYLEGLKIIIRLEKDGNGHPSIKKWQSLILYERDLFKHPHVPSLVISYMCEAKKKGFIEFEVWYKESISNYLDWKLVARSGAEFYLLVEWTFIEKD